MLMIHQQETGTLDADLRGSRGGGQGVRLHLLKNHKNIGVFSNTGPDPLKNHTVTKQTFNVETSSARQRNYSLCRFAGGPMMARF